MGALPNLPWGKGFRWGIVERKVRTRDSRGKLQLRYAMVENSTAVFLASRCVAKDLSYEEAAALCTIMNAGGDSE